LTDKDKVVYHGVTHFTIDKSEADQANVCSALINTAMWAYIGGKLGNSLVGGAVGGQHANLEQWGKTVGAVTGATGTAAGLLGAAEGANSSMAIAGTYTSYHYEINDTHYDVVIGPYSGIGAVVWNWAASILPANFNYSDNEV
jgi:hypothetical protein